MTVVLYDKLGFNEDILLDLPFREGVGAITRDVAKPHHPVTLVNTPTWTALPSGLMVLNLNGTNEYLQCLGASCADLNFTNGDYSAGCWFNWTDTGQSLIVMGRYRIDSLPTTISDGWEIYLDTSMGLNTVSQRHNHLSLVPNTNSNCYSVGWTPGTPWFLGISRIGGNLYPVHYRNGVALDMTYEDSGMLDPDTSIQDLVIGCRWSKDANWYKNWMWRPRVWGRALSAEDWMNMYQLEKRWFA